MKLISFTTRPASLAMLAIFHLSTWDICSAFSTFTTPIGYVESSKNSKSMDVAKPASDVHSVLIERRTVNDFDPTLPPGWEEALKRAITAATYAPNHKRTEPWRFHLLGAEAIQGICKLNADIVTEKKGEAAGKKKLERWLQMPGWLVVTCQRDASSPSMDEDPSGLARENYAAVCCAVQNLCLSLHADGIGTKWTSGPVNFHPAFAKTVGLSEDQYVVGTLWFGRAEKIPDAPKKRLAIEDILIRHA
mmetsp:Transcript_15727/g.45332  ORF Transcript_15727/g.45332 Transcript_15727/m.45332 type:complete len:248 (+) Transcript_15727:167-910(+)